MIKGLNFLPQGHNSEPEKKKKNLDFPQKGKKKQKKLLTALLALECETGMLLSYYKGGLITENNVFVFSSVVLVTQCYVRANLLQLLHTKKHQVAAAESVPCTSGTPGSRWSAAKMWNR